MSKHKQVRVKCSRTSNKCGRETVDEGMVKILQSLWKLRVDTYMSCEDNSGKVWIAFPSTIDCLKFLVAIDARAITISDIQFRKKDERITFDALDIRFPKDLKDKVEKRLGSIV